jgi:CheY-like chemotaxis protein
MSSRQARILLLEDDASMRELLRMVLEGAGHTVIDVADGEAGIACFNDGTAIDLVISDLLMHGLDGLSFLRWLRGAGHPTPVPMNFY